MRIAVCFNKQKVDRPDVSDVLEESDLVAKSLKQLRYAFALFAMPVGQSGMHQALGKVMRYAPDVVFNLVESPGLDGRTEAAAAGVWAALDVPYTGCPYPAILLTADKPVAKALLQRHGLTTPEWEVYHHGTPELRIPGPWIVKPVWEDASYGINENAFFTSQEKLRAQIGRMRALYRQPLLIESFINGREFNVGMVEAESGDPEVLPPAEIVFDDWPENRPKILTYQAKWEPSSLYYRNTRRVFVDAPDLVRRLSEAALACWKIFGLRGYARVDFREQGDGTLQIIEVNANPGIAADSGLIAAAREAGYRPAKIVQRIIRCALQRAKKRRVAA